MIIRFGARRGFAGFGTGGILRSGLSMAGARAAYVSPPHPGYTSPLSHGWMDITADQLTPGISRAEYQARVDRLLHGNNPITGFPFVKETNAIVIQPSYRDRYLSGKIFYPFHGNTNLAYLTGLNEPNAIAVFVKNKEKHKSILFVKEPSETEVLWEGPRIGIRGAREFYGADEAYDLDSFIPVLEDLVKLSEQKSTFGVRQPVVTYFDTPAASRHDVTADDSMQHLSLPKDIMSILATTQRKPLAPLLDSMRLIKSPTEISQLSRACSIASRAFNKVLSQTLKQNLKGENEVAALFEYECRMAGAIKLAYVPVVAGCSANANIIHYTRNDMLLQKGDLMLMDAGCIVGGYGSDISRTFPISGRFSPSQRKIYDALASIQESLIAATVEGSASLNSLLTKSQDMIRKQIVQGLFGISDATLAKAVTRRIYPHHVGHYLGLDVHDCASVATSLPLKARMCLTIEPGIYIPPQLDGVSYDAMLEAIPVEYRGIAIRIEDDLCVSPNGAAPLVMTSEAVKKSTDIERLMN